MKHMECLLKSEKHMKFCQTMVPFIEKSDFKFMQNEIFRTKEIKDS